MREGVAAPSEHKTVQSRILHYAQEIGWCYVSRAAAGARRGFDPDGATPEERARPASLYFGDLLHEQVLAFNPKYKEAEGALVGAFQRLNADIAGNRDFLAYLRNQGKFFCAEENRELDLQLIDYADLTRLRGEWRNVYEVTEEFFVHNGHHGTWEDVVFLINGIPVLVIECKNATKDEAIALGVDQIRRYHAETPEVMVPEMLFTATEAIGFAYGVTWNTVRRNIFRWKHEDIGNLEAKAKSFCAEHFRDKERRKEFFKEYKEIEMLYEIISPDAFLRPFIGNYAALSSIYAVVRNAYAKKVYVDKAFQQKTNVLVQQHVGSMLSQPSVEYAVLGNATLETIKQRREGDATKVINLVKAIEKTAEENSDDPFLVALAERARAVQESFEDRQTATAEALAELLKEIEKNEQRKKEQTAKGLDAMTYFVLCKLTDDGIPNPEIASRKVAAAYAKHPNWRCSEAELREVRKQVTSRSSPRWKTSKR